MGSVILSHRVPDLFLWLQITNFIIMVTIGVLYLNQLLCVVLSVFRPKRKFRLATKNHAYGIVIPARNEENVIGDLIESIRAQNYPTDLVHIFVIADNCSDRTATTAAEKGAIVFRRFNEEKKGKSYALDFGFKNILNDYADMNIEAFIVFDADNLLSENFLREINKAYDEGYKVTFGFGVPKNFCSSWISAGSSLMVLRESLHAECARTYVSGNGYLLDKSFAGEMNGWNLNMHAAIKNQKIAFCEDAVFYDEQTVTIRDSYRQRLRRCQGRHQAFRKESFSLFKSMLRKPSFAKWEMFVRIVPVPAFLFMWTMFYLTAGICWFAFTDVPFETCFQNAFIHVLKDFGYLMLAGFLMGTSAAIQYRKYIECPFLKTVLYLFLFPLYMILFLPITTIGLFMKKDLQREKEKKS